MYKLLIVTIMAACACLAGEWTGHVSDSKCGKAHTDHSENSINCVKACVKAGQEPVFVTEAGDVVKIENPDKVMAHLGHKVKVTGNMSGDTLNIEEVEHLAP